MKRRARTCNARPVRRPGAIAHALRVHAPADQVQPLLPLAVSVWTDGADRCIVEVGSDTPHQLALYVGLLDTDFDIWIHLNWQMHLYASPRH